MISLPRPNIVRSLRFPNLFPNVSVMPKAIIRLTLRFPSPILGIR